MRDNAPVFMGVRHTFLLKAAVALVAHMSNACAKALQRCSLLQSVRARGTRYLEINLCCVRGAKLREAALALKEGCHRSAAWRACGGCAQEGFATEIHFALAVIRT